MDHYIDNTWKAELPAPKTRKERFKKWYAAQKAFIQKNGWKNTGKTILLAIHFRIARHSTIRREQLWNDLYFDFDRIRAVWTRLEAMRRSRELNATPRIIDTSSVPLITPQQSAEYEKAVERHDPINRLGVDTRTKKWVMWPVDGHPAPKKRKPASRTTKKRKDK